MAAPDGFAALACIFAAQAALASAPEQSSEEVREAILDAEFGWQAGAARDILGNPFGPAAVEPAWRTPDAVAVARHIYEVREFGTMPVLADALQDAGCDDEAVLGHLRGEGPHCRVCNVLDLILGRE